jgi:nicotinamidase-related amidase
MPGARAALLVIDVQHALCGGEYACFEADRVIERINSVARRVRESGGLVILIQHESESGPLAHGSEGWQLAGSLATAPSDIRMRKTATDSFHKTALHATLQEREIDRLIICGLQSDFCVDTTTRRALALGYPVTLVADGHSTMDNSTLKAAQITAHHNETLCNITSFGPRATAIPAGEISLDFEAR